MKFKKMDLQGDIWLTQNLVGEALNGYLKVQITPVFCPPEAMEIIDKRIKQIYKMAFENAITQIRDSLMFIDYEE